MLAELVESLTTTPAVVVNGSWDVIASNVLARAISPSFTVGTNLASALFDNERARRTLPRWGEVSARMVSLLKEAHHDSSPDDTRIDRLRTELERRSEEFRRAWSEGVLPDDYALHVPMDHPEVGRLTITYEVMRVPDSDSSLVIGHAEPGSTSEKRLFELVSKGEPWIT
ncbi:hypothetical protein [Homoserinibacter sp. GY 40078]|uniref:MmyB family transcriptional regulator n=1 Tax=Homoserinibacter sp. GY 40078 TaxID=2603275 RepID=UPI0011CA2751|nr:hypothetical protein [Homoserinibacter sp. GY 40078]TXK19319.1 hypothetical protein FVQ89_05235 [Homoserinibacter sp. GY 40078]